MHSKQPNRAKRREKVDQQRLAETAMARLQRGTVENKVSHRVRKSVSPSSKIS